MPVEDGFAGSREQPGEINLAQFKASALTCLEPARPSKIRSKPVVCPLCSVGL